MIPEYYWELITRDGSRFEVPPSAVPVVKRRMDNHDPINFKTASVPYAQIEHFRITDKVYTDQPLLDSVAQAFKEEQISETGDMQVRWVKKTVTQDKWNKYYSANPAYRLLAEEGGMSQIAFRVPVHQIDQQLTPYCTEEEVSKLNNKY